MKQQPILKLQQSNLTINSNLIFGLILVGSGIYLATLPIYSSGNDYDLVVVGVALLFWGLYHWNKASHQVLLFDHQVQSKTLISNTKTPLLTHSYAYTTEIPKNNRTVLVIITPTLNKGLTISTEKWNNYDAFETALNTRLNELNRDTSLKPSKKIRHRAYQNELQKKNKFSVDNTFQKEKMKGMSRDNKKRFKKTSSKNLKNTYEKNGVKIVRTGTGRPNIVKKKMIQEKDDLSGKVSASIGAFIALMGLIWAGSILFYQGVNMYRELFNSVFIICIGIGIAAYSQFAK